MIKKYLFLTLFIVTTVFINPGLALAFDQTQRFEIERRPNFDRTDCYPQTVSQTQSSGIQKGQTYWVGDSISVGLKSAGMEGKMATKGYSTQINANGGRSITSAGQANAGGPHENGLQALESDRDYVAGSKNVIIALGTNLENDFRKAQSDMIKKVKEINPSASIAWVDLSAVGVVDPNTNKSTYNKGLAQDTNIAIYDRASELSYSPISQFKYVWGADQDPKTLASKSLPTPNTTPLSNDGIHYKDYSALGDYLVEQISFGGSQTLTPTTPSTPAPTTPSTPANPSDKTTIPEVFISIFKKAAQKYNTDPGLLATIYYIEHGRNFAEPPPPYGNGPAYASSPAGASGPFQFIPSTWSAYGEDGNSDGKVDVQDLTDAAFAAAHLLSSMGGTAGKTIGDVNNPYQENTYLPVMIGYNWGPLHVQRKDLPLPNETSNYIKYGSEAYPSISAQMGGAAPPTSTGCNNQQQSNNASPGSLQRVVEVAQAEFAAGANEADGSNLKYISRGHQEAWCADFVSWVLRESGFPFTGGIGENGWNIPTVDGVQAYFEKQGAFHPARSGYTPQPGDVVVYNEGVSPYPSHVNIVIEVNGGGMTTIGGNEGNKVSRNTHASFDAPYITGFGTPGVKK